MQLTTILTPARVRVPLSATNKLQAITEMIDLLDQTEALGDRSAVLEAVLKRENERTTGIGYGLAIPHGKSAGVRGVALAAGKPAQPIEYNSLDGRPVNFVVMLVSPPDQNALHIQALATISKLMNLEAFRARITRAATAEELYAAIREHDAS